MREVDLTEYEPACFETYIKDQPIALATLLEGVSYGAQWVHLLPPTLEANAAICVFAPSMLRSPQNCSLTYLGSFPYNVPANQEW